MPCLENCLGSGSPILEFTGMQILSLSPRDSTSTGLEEVSSLFSFLTW